MTTHTDLNDFAENLTARDFAGTTAHTGEQATTLGRALLENALGGPEGVDKALGGRPSLSTAGISPSRTVRLPRDLDSALINLARAEGRKPSAIVRDAVADYLAQHHAS
ncbi:ribbon-helix-helix domain-containing protein [Propionicimonas sp.]|jgi:hypothetical protein|uniref:ribbon-helix-helix domain-containing protein n=1 Tax=Propionicimonas sp. TaxID=1955623 RepID=UPI00185637E1|nr:ribbon-helix-helix domain-containing protein [Propionicimonas sp.]MBA3019649.1 CopG family transcriptional regulator [Propionicimonas sp.]MBU4208006.1 ribbon-helix-helix domain-containing protein [Actinomycetota bacterium]MBU4411456.1 ribbon-helix-helix domain-containing protein [Actinomycetota bacterium]MCG2805768.1 ribbon-helix-helix domain-containing protein [Propionicimonas sp.]